MVRKGSIYFPNLFSLFVLAITPFFPHFWFIFPTAVSILVRSRVRVYQLLAYFTFAITLVSIRGRVEELDLLAFAILFVEGLFLHLISKASRRLNLVVFVPLLGSFLLGALVFFLTKQPSFSAFIGSQLNADIFPYFFRVQDWPEPLVGFYQTVLLPVLEAGLLAWFAAMMALAFFINGVLESLLRSMTSRRSKRPQVWEAFSHWKAPDFVLISLLLGLIVLVLPRWDPSLQFRGGEFLGWHLMILSLFPIFIQGVAVASFFIPRASMMVFVVIFTLLVLKPVPVLLLAGLCDLWFDFRSKIRSDPRIER